MSETAVEDAAAILAESRSVFFITGAGVSAESGLPTYRGIGGLYDCETTEEGVAIEDALSGSMLQRRPELCWKYISQIEQACRGAKPNAAHRIMAAAEQEFERAWVLTQNVDGLHRAAGSVNLIAIHGDVDLLYCTQCSWREAVTDYGGLTIPPSCPECSGLVRPNVVLFGEALPAGALTVLYRELAEPFDAVFSVGTSSLFPYIAEPVMRARHAGIPTVEINPGETPVSEVVDVRVKAPAAAALSEVWTALGKELP